MRALGLTCWKQYYFGFSAFGEVEQSSYAPPECGSLALEGGAGIDTRDTKVGGGGTEEGRHDGKVCSSVEASLSH